MNNIYKVDIAIFGAGISGLWLFNSLKAKGYNVILIENTAIGGHQTMASQGMIHGGQRYTLQGALSSHSESIATMPKIWDECLEGTRNPNLKNVQILSKKQYLWSNGGFTSNVTAFFASKAMNSRVNALDQENLPPIFKSSNKFKGKVYELDEVVIDIKSLAESLSYQFIKDIYKADEIIYNVENNKLVNVALENAGEKIILSAKKYIFTSGKGNEKIANLISPKKQITQARPIKQIMVREVEYPLYAHCITTDPRPRVTISAHPLDNGKYVWYLGGLVAVYGTDKSDKEAISFAKKELKTLFSWIDWDNKEWSTLLIDRAEPYTATGLLPEGPQVKEIDNCVLVWPTKLTFAPAITDKIINILNDKQIKENDTLTELPFRQPEIAKYPWEESEWKNS